MNYGVIVRPEVILYSGRYETKEDKQGTISAISDQALYGMTEVTLEESDGWKHILTFYGYEGYIHSEDARSLTEEELQAYLHADLKVVNSTCLDVRSIPSDVGEFLLTLPGGAIVEALEENEETGWTKIRLLDGSIGYVASSRLETKRFSEDYLFEDNNEVLGMLQKAALRDRKTKGGRNGFSLKAVEDHWYSGSDAAFRENVVKEAMKYLGTQYRWGGRSAQGVDCSGLLSMSYLRSGVTIYRDAAVADGFPMQALDLEWDEEGHFSLHNLEGNKLLPGDALYFGGHVAMYIGDGKYIHSTARKGDNGVVINSLDPNSELFRRDLLERIYAVAGVRA